jgi:VIT1/CCC1 family predicted Fe2+/Mn2+ transporter
MVSYEYLEKMFRRLAEAREHLAHHDAEVRKRAMAAGMSKAEKRKIELAYIRERNLLVGATLHIEYSIRDYLKEHGGAA